MWAFVGKRGYPIIINRDLYGGTNYTLNIATAGDYKVSDKFYR